MNRDHRTIAASSGIGGIHVPGSVTPPLYATDTYEWQSPDEKPAFDYSRTVNPNRALLLDALCQLEGAAGGAITSSGQSAALLALLSLKAGARIIAPHDCYGGTYRLLAAWAAQANANVIFIDQRDDAIMARGLSGGVDLLWIESPSNPLLRLVDIERRASEARAAGGANLVDNTVATPCRQNPLSLGCDYVLHSTTKAINGHHDLFGGALLCASHELSEQLEYWCNAAGLAASAFDTWQALRGLRTLPLRVDSQEQTAQKVAHFLDRSDAVKTVNYPGLADHPDFELCKRQCSGPGFMLSFEIEGDQAQVNQFVAELKLVTLAPSLGGFSSLICTPATMTHRGMPPEAQRTAGITPGLLRLSVGLESANSLIADLSRGLKHA